MRSSSLILVFFNSDLCFLAEFLLTLADRGEVRCQVVSAFVLVGGEVCLVRAVSSSGHVTPTAALVRLITRLISFSLIFLERMCRGEGSRGGRLLFDFPHIWSMADYARARLLSFACCTLTVTICDGWGSIQV